MRTDSLIFSIVLTVLVVTVLVVTAMLGATWVGDWRQAGTAQVATVYQPCLHGAYVPVDGYPLPTCPPWRVPADSL